MIIPLPTNGLPKGALQARVQPQSSRPSAYPVPLLTYSMAQVGFPGVLYLHKMSTPNMHVVTADASGPGWGGGRPTHLKDLRKERADVFPAPTPSRVTR
jgi:hypothetical protein